MTGTWNPWFRIIRISLPRRRPAGLQPAKRASSWQQIRPGLARHMANHHSAWSVIDAAGYLARHVADPLTFRRVLSEALRDPDVMTVLPESLDHPERLLATWSRIQAEADLVAGARLLAGRQSALPGGDARDGQYPDRRTT